MLSALAALTLTGCAHSGAITKPSYPVLPADLQVCFVHTVPAPKAGTMSKAQVLKLIADLKQSEGSKTACGKRLIKFYDALG